MTNTNSTSNTQPKSTIHKDANSSTLDCIISNAHLLHQTRYVDIASLDSKYQSFANPEVIVTTFDDKRLAVVSKSECRFEQDAYGPTYVVIRPTATDEQLNKVASRFKITLLDLKAFREHIAV